MTTLYEMGIEKDREAAMYIIDRIKGKPKAIQDIHIDAELVSAETVREFRRLVDAEPKLLQEGSQEQIAPPNP